MSYGAHLSEDHLAIFLLHGVVDTPPRLVRNYTRKHLQREYFAAFLDDLLERGGQPIALDEYVKRSAQGARLPDKAFAITFDDGFENNLSVAAPVLASRGVPATFYVTTSFVAENRMSWIDRIELALEPARAGSLSLPWGRDLFDDDASKRRVLDTIRKRVKADSSIQPDELATKVQIDLGLRPTWSSPDPLDLKLSWDGVRELASGPLFTVGGHTHTHAIMSFLDDAGLTREIDTSLELLKSKVGISTTHYSYPEGLEHCYSERVIAALKERGITCCPTAEPGTNLAGADPFRLRRIMVT